MPLGQPPAHSRHGAICGRPRMEFTPRARRWFSIGMRSRKQRPVRAWTARLRNEANWEFGQACGTKPIGGSDGVAERSQFGRNDRRGNAACGDGISFQLCFSSRLPAVEALAGAGRNRFLSPHEEENKPLWPPYERCSTYESDFEPPRGIGRRTWSRNELLLGERAAFFRFQSSRRVRRGLRMGRASD